MTSPDVRIPTRQRHGERLLCDGGALSAEWLSLLEESSLGSQERTWRDERYSSRL